MKVENGWVHRCPITISPFHFPLERISHSKVEGKIAAEFRMDNGITVFFLLIRRIDGFIPPSKRNTKKSKSRRNPKPYARQSVYRTCQIQTDLPAGLYNPVLSRYSRHLQRAPLNFQNNRVRYSMLASSLMSPDWFMKLLSPGKEPGPKSRTDHPRTLLRRRRSSASQMEALLHCRMEWQYRHQNEMPMNCGCQ